MIEVGMTVWHPALAEPYAFEIKSIEKEGSRLIVKSTYGVTYQCREGDLIPCVVIDVKSCARCGKDHENLAFRPLNSHDDWSHFHMCPNVNQPILMKVE